MTPGTSATVRPRLAGARLARAELQPRRRRLVPLLMVLVIIAGLLMVTGWVFGFSSAFAARSLKITGVRTLSADEVQAAARVPLGTPLARQDLDGIGARVAALGPVRSVRVSRSWPETVAIDISERTPVLAVPEQGGFSLIDDQGQAYLRVPAVPRRVALAHVNPADTRLLADAGVVAAALPEELRSRVASVDTVTMDSITLRLHNGDVVFWGSSAESPLKAQVLAALLKRDAVRYDVSSPQSPALR